MYMYNPHSPMIPPQMYTPGKRRDKTETAVSSDSYDPNTARQEQQQYYLNNIGILDPRRLRSANSLRAEVTGSNNNNSIANSPGLGSRPPVLQQQNPNTQDINTSALAPHIGNAPSVLMQQGQQQPEPVLNQPFYPTPTGALPEPVTPVAEDLPPLPPEKQGFGDRLMRYMDAQEARGETPLSQKLIAMGSAMQGSSHLGRNAAMAAMGQAYNDTYTVDQANQQVAYEKQRKLYEDNKDYLNKLDETDRQYTDALAKFDQFGNSVTGIYDSNVTSQWDNLGFGDPQREAFRVELKQLIVNNTLLNTAQTKGAISDKEMALFKSGVPSMNASEKVWKAWIEARQTNLRVIRNRIASGITVGRSADVGFDNTYTVTSNDQGSESTQNSQPTYTQEEDDALFY